VTGDGRPQRPLAAVVGPLGPGQIACIESWRAAGVRVAFIHFGDRRPLRFAPRLLDHYSFIVDPGRDASAWDSIAALLDGAGVTAAATVAYSVGARLKAALDRRGSPIRLAAADEATQRFLDTKSAQLALAAEVGLAVDPHWMLTAADTSAIPDAAFPVVVRPDFPKAAVPAFKAEFADDRGALEALLAPLQPGFSLIVQSFRNTPNLVVHGSRDSAGKAGPTAGFLVDYKFRGVTQRIAALPLPAAFARRCETYVEAMGFVGAYHFEFLYDADIERSRFLEINGRLGGTTGKVVHLGYDEPVLLLNALGIEVPVRPVPSPRRYVSNRFSLLRRAAQVAKGDSSRLDYPALGGVGGALRLLGGVAAWRDEVSGGRHWRLVADYYREALG
jgi:hypothetical protein